MGTRADTTRKWFSAFGRDFRTVHKGFLVLNLTLFVVCVADWIGWLPFERGFQPLRMVYLSGALVLLPAASLVQRRSMLAYLALTAASMAMLVAAVTIRP